MTIRLTLAMLIWRKRALRRSLPFENQRDFDEAQRGFIAAPGYKRIMAEAGNLAWDLGSYDFLLRCFDSVFDCIHPSLPRQAILNMAYGLYEVFPNEQGQIARSRDLSLFVGHAQCKLFAGKH